MSKEGEEAPQGGGNAGDPGKKDPNAELFENRGTKKMIRLVTVVAYMFSVSFVGVALSAYYLFLWDPPNPRLIRAHPISEPQVQFLLADPATSLSHEEFSNEFPRKNTKSEEKETSSLRPLLLGRLIGDEFIDDADRVAGKRRRKLEESLFVLRNSLIELLRGKVNDTIEQDSENGEEKSFNLLVERKGRINATEKMDESGEMVERKTGSEAGRDPGTKDEEIFPGKLDHFARNETDSSTMNVSTILDDQEGETSSKIDKDGRGMFWKKYYGEKMKGYSRNFSSMEAKESIDRENMKNVNIGGKFDGGRIREEAEGRGTHLTDTSSSNGNDTVDNVTTNGRMDSGEDKLGKSMGKRARPIDFSISNETVGDSSRKVDFIDRLEVSQRPETSSADLTNAAMNSNETQIEKMTTKSAALESGRSTEEPEVTSTNGQRDLLTILMETTSTEAYSSDFSSTVPQDLPTEPSTSTKVIQKQSELVA